MSTDAQPGPAAELSRFAAEHGLSLAAAQGLLGDLRSQAGAERFYIFWTSGGGGKGAGGAGRLRTLLAFPTPDAALVFVQRNQLARAAEQPRLRRLTLLQLLQAMLREPSIEALLFVDDADEQLVRPGHLPPGTRIERADLISRLRCSPGA